MFGQRHIHRIHKFKHADSLYVADLERCRILEIDQVIWDILEGYSQTDDAEQLMCILSERYGKADIESAFETLSKLGQMGLIFESKGKEATYTPDSSRPRVFVYGAYSQDAVQLAAGGHIAHQSLLWAMKEYADLYFVDNTGQTDFGEGIYGIPFRVNEPSSLLSLNRYSFDGILVDHPAKMEFISILEHLNIPVVVPIHTIRGHESMINCILIWYAAMRDFDAFYAPANSTREFYSRFLLDSERFYTIYNGVDSDIFKPIEKDLAKRKVAEIVGDERLLTQPVVGFLSRFQPEKGAGIFIRLAEMNPDALFLAVAPKLNVYSIRNLPPNFIYSGPQPRERIPLFFNAFDVYCFPSMVGEETCPLSILEAMACGLPIVSAGFTGIPEILGDAGVLVPAITFPNEIGSFAAYFDYMFMHEEISSLLKDKERRQRLGDKARKRSLNYAWSNAARELLQLFKKLNKIRVSENLHPGPRLSVIFSDWHNFSSQQMQQRAILLNLGKYGENPLMYNNYFQSVEEGLVLELAKDHNYREIEVVLRSIFNDEDRVKNLLLQIKGFITATS